MVVCVNGGIRLEYSSLSPHGQIWWASVVAQSRYRNKPKAIRQPQRVDFVKKKNVPLHSEDFDYVDAASQSNTLVWLSNEGTWQVPSYRSQIYKAFRVAVQDVNEYVPAVTS